MKPARAKSKRASPEERLKQLQAQIAAKQKRAELQQTIVKARADLKALRLSGKR